MKSDLIRPIAICLFRKNNRLLVFLDHDDQKGDDFCRPLGGGISFGETSGEALVREIREELGAEIDNLQLLGVLENIFVYNGQPGHEIAFVYDAVLLDAALYEEEILEGWEDSGTSFTAQWLSLDEIHNRSMRLVPDGLEGLLLSLSMSPWWLHA